MMTYRYMKNEKALPLWAALGAPLIGVPLMVGLLSLVAPKAEAPAEESTPELVTEPLDTYGVEPVSSDSALKLDVEFNAG